MTGPIPVPDLATAALASLNAASTAEDLDLRTFYAASARSAINLLHEHVLKLKSELAQVEAGLLKRAPKRMTGAERK